MSKDWRHGLQGRLKDVQDRVATLEGGGADPWQKIKRTFEVTAAQLLALNGATQLLLLAGEAGYVFVPTQHIHVWWKYGGVHFTGIDSWIGYVILGTNLNGGARFGYANGENFGIGSADLFEKVSEGHFGGTSPDQWANAGIYLKRQSGSLTDPGGANDSLILDVFYYRVPTGLMGVPE